MKKTLSVVLMVVLVSTPCFAQEIEPDGLFSIEGTLWRLGTEIMFATIPPFFQINYINEELGFHQGKIYRCFEDNCNLLPYVPYINSPVLSIAYFFNVIEFGLIIMQPIGLGISTYFGSLVTIPGFCYSITLMYKVGDNWTPPPDVE